MNRSHHWLNKNRLITLLVTSLSFGAVNAEDSTIEAITPYLRQAWHDVEVIVFERPGVGDVHAGENLTLTEPRRLPSRFLSLTTNDWLNSLLPLDDETREAITTFSLGQARDMAGTQATDATTPLPEDATEEPATTVAEPPPPPTPEEIFRATLKTWEDDVEASTFIARSPEDRALATAASRLATQGGARILWHERWTQALAKPGNSVPILVYGGPLLIDRFQLEGTVDISRTDAIEARARVWLNGPNVGREPILVATDASARDAVPDPIALVMDRYLAINEQRTLAPGELTYFDHPRFGVLIRVRPVTPPESVLVAFEAFRTGGDELRD